MAAAPAPNAARRIAAIEALVGQDVGRSIQALTTRARGGLLGAARGIAEHPAPHVAVITGFYVPWAPTPAAETDGPIGAAHLLAALARAGIACRAVSDTACVGPLRAALSAAEEAAAIPVDVAAMDNPAFPGGTPLDRLVTQWREMALPITHVVSIERVGPARDGIPRNFRGEDLSTVNAPLERLFAAGPWARIAIGDGGNEIGMGSIPAEVIAADVANGENIACIVPADHLMVCGVSNWGGYALTAALALLRSDLADALLSGLTTERDREMLRRAVEDGPAVDGIQGVRALQADGLPWERHAAVLEEVRALAGASLPSPDRT